ncbi:MAG: FMN-binding protein [Acholeplasmataceae bacterium]|nr:FMN-binding protein [Acholeplasmataceae bacterium]
MHKRTKILLIVLIVIGIISLLGTYFIRQINQEMNELTVSEIPTINLSNIEDGTYMGTYQSMLITVKLEVVIQNHVITNITIMEHQNGQGDSAEVIIDDVINMQSIEVDFISGASYSSKAILLAIGDALS